MDSLANNLMQWLKTFNVRAPHETLEDLLDGCAISEVLNNIAPEFFDQTWLSKIKTDAGSNWRLRVSNLKKILKAITDYYAEVLGQQIVGFRMPDVNAIAEKNDSAELGRLLQLVLGCAVNCERKHEYIAVITGLEEALQHVVMNAIQELITEIPTTYPIEIYADLNEQLKGLTEDLHSANESKEQITQRCHELDMQVALLLEEKSNLLSENEKLRERLNYVENFEDSCFNTGKKHPDIRKRIDILQDEVFKLEIGRDELKTRVESQEEQIADLQHLNEELKRVAGESEKIKDEWDVLREKAAKVDMYESKIEIYKKRMEDLSEVKRQVKILEEKNTQYMEKNMELEEDLKKSATLKSQLDMYKKQSQELHSKLSEETKKADKAEFESRRLHEKITSLHLERERLIIERDSLKESLEELRCMQQQNVSSHEGHGSSRSLGESDIFDGVPPEIREKLIRLQHENKILKLNESTNIDKQLTLLQSMLDDSKSRENELKTDNKLANRRIMELESQLEDLHENKTVNVQEESDLKQKFYSALKKQKETETELHKKNVVIESLESQIEVSVLNSHHLQELLNKKEEEMRAMEVRYRKYLDKAKKVIQSFDPIKSPAASMDVSTLKTVLQEKEEKINSLEKEAEKIRVTQEMEDKLITSALYNMGARLQRKVAEERLSQTGVGVTFLGRQRQATSRRLTTPGVASSEFFEY